MHLEKSELILVIKNALNEQHEGPATSSSGSPYIYGEEVGKIGIDGYIDLEKLADKIIEADVKKYKNPY